MQTDFKGKDDVLYGFAFDFLNLGQGISFKTDVNEELQCAVMTHPSDYVIKRHFHPSQIRSISKTSECLFLLEGVLEMSIFHEETFELLFQNEIIGPSVIVLLRGGHGFVCKTPVKIVEIKQGPFEPSLDKVHF